MNKSDVYLIKNISSTNIVKIYKALDINLTPKVGVKVHSGEDGNQNYLRAEFLKDIVNHVDGTIIECNTAYEGKRNTVEEHWKLMKKHNWSTLYDVDILDEDEQIAFEIPNGKIIKKNYVGKNIIKYNSLLVISHFKGHPMGGYGGALKNMSIGLASSYGKAYIHGAGKPEDIWTAEHNLFLESMADASLSIMKHFKNNIVFINIMSNMSVDCDCCAIAEDPCMNDIGILASLDPVALDQACIDLIYSSNDKGKEHLIERIESRNGIHTIEAAEKINVGTRNYNLVEIY